MKIEQALTELGLHDKEPEVYMAMLRFNRPLPASIIASRSGLNRTTVYKTLMRLTKKGLCTKTQKYGITYFFAEDPENRLKTLIDKRQKTFDEINEMVLTTIPLLKMHDEAEGAFLPRIRYYEGIEGLKQIYDAVLKEGKDYYLYGNIHKIYPILGSYIDDYIERRDSMDIDVCVIMPLYEKKKDVKESKNKRIKRLYIPHKLFPIEGEVRIFGNKVAIISLEKTSPIGVIIESETIAKMFMAIFMLTWKEYDKSIFEKQK